MDTVTVFTTVAALVASVGGAGALILLLSGWLGRVWATRLAVADRARIDAELARLTHSLSQEASSELDALTRRRAIYARLATSMRIFLKGGDSASLEKRHEFLAAYDEACVWASESVALSLGEFLDANSRNAAQPSAENADVLKRAYGACIRAMREDSGFDNTAFEYRFVTF
jgi:hypothetical protein